ncbi:unnamed protein product [Lampetra planeri]
MHGAARLGCRLLLNATTRIRASARQFSSFRSARITKGVFILAAATSPAVRQQQQQTLSSCGGVPSCPGPNSRPFRDAPLTHGGADLYGVDGSTSASLTEPRVVPRRFHSSGKRFPRRRGWRGGGARGEGAGSRMKVPFDGTTGIVRVPRCPSPSTIADAFGKRRLRRMGQVCAQARPCLIVRDLARIGENSGSFVQRQTQRRAENAGAWSRAGWRCPPGGAVHKVELSTRWSCPPGGAIHLVELSTRWSCPPGGAVHQAELSTRWSYPPGGAVHQVELSTRRSCPPGGAVHLFTRVE